MRWLSFRAGARRDRIIVALACAALGGGGLLASACSSEKGGFTDSPEAGRDGTTQDDSSTEDGPRDAGRDVVVPLGDAEGNCSAVTGECDIVGQNCAAGPNGQPLQCDVVQGPDGGIATGCVPTRASQRLPKGHTCCPNAQGGDPCLPGLTCLGNACAGDAAPTARCSPHCCQGSNGLCGQSDPEGFAGECDYNVSYGQTPAYFACSYSGQCKFFGLQSCPSGFTCIPQDKFGTAKCYDIFNPDGGAGGLGEMQPCSSANSCADGFLCVGGADAGSVCRMLCLVPLSNPPFDAGALEGGALRGGCSAGRSCSISFNPQSLPSWMGACAAPDGG